MTGSTLINSAGSVGAAEAVLSTGRSTRKSIAIVNTHATQTLYVGAVGVTTANGFPLSAGQSIEFIDLNGPISCIGSGAATTYRILEVY